MKCEAINCAWISPSLSPPLPLGSSPHQLGDATFRIPPVRFCCLVEVVLVFHDSKQFNCFVRFTLVVRNQHSGLRI